MSEIGLGAMQFGQKMNMGNLDRRATQELVEFALDSGVNFIDTADVYSLGSRQPWTVNAVPRTGPRVTLAVRSSM